MSAILITAIILIIDFAIFYVIRRKQRSRRMVAGLVKYIRQIGVENHLNFSSQEVLKNGIIGFDGISRKLVFLEKDGDENYHHTIIDLNELKACTLKRYYQNNGAGRKGRINKLALQFSFNRNQSPVEISFYKWDKNHLAEMPELENKARHWETILTKMQVPYKNTA